MDSQQTMPIQKGPWDSTYPARKVSITIFTYAFIALKIVHYSAFKIYQSVIK